MAREFPAPIVDALRLLTHTDDGDYFDYVRKIRENPVAKAVKLADFAHNSDETRFAGAAPNAVDLAWRREKYAKAFAILNGEIE